MEAVVKVHTLPRRAVRGGAAREAKAAPNLEGSALATRESQVEVGDVEGRRRLLPERGWWEEVCVRHPCGEVYVTVNPNPNPFSLVSLGFLSFSFLGFFLFVYGPTLERCLYRPEIGPYMVWFYTWTTFVDNFVDKVLDDIFWFGYLVSL